MKIDWEASREAWIGEVKSDLLPHLLEKQNFPDATIMARRFDEVVATWRSNDLFRPVIENGNELAAAAAILKSLPAGDTLRYEFPITGTKKTIDFLAISADGRRAWIDVKTVAPAWQDDEAGWQRFVKLAQDFPNNAHLGVDKDWGGAGIAGQEIKTRWSFITRTADVERKATLLPANERGPVWLLFCSNGSAWHDDDLEDFADFYRTGRFREDDWARNAMARYMTDEGIAFTRALAGFHYLGRRHEETHAHEFHLNVRGPTFGAG